MNNLSVRNSTAESLDANNLNVRKNEKSPSREPAIGLPSKYRMALGALALAMCLGLPRVSAAQDQPPQDQSSQPGESAGAPPSAESAPPPAAESAPPAAEAAPEAAPQPQNAPPAARNSTVPDTLTVPAGAVIPVRIQQWLSSDQNQAGDTFNAVLDQPLIVNGWVVARRGQTVTGRVVLAQKAGHGNTESKLGIELSQLTVVDGQQLPVSTQLIQNARARSQARDAATLGGTTALGAIIGGAAGGGSGAAIGAAAGIGAGIAAIMATPGRPTIIRPETLLSFQLQAPVDISTSQSQVAFRPVTQADYGRDQDAYANSPRLRYGPGAGAPYAPYPPPPYYYYGYPGPVYFGPGFYGGFGFGPRVFVGRGFFH
jgi:hypothetical protein